MKHKFLLCIEVWKSGTFSIREKNLLKYIGCLNLFLAVNCVCEWRSDNTVSEIVRFSMQFLYASFIGCMQWLFQTRSFQIYSICSYVHVLTYIQIQYIYWPADWKFIKILLQQGSCEREEANGQNEAKNYKYQKQQSKIKRKY